MDTFKKIEHGLYKLIRNRFLGIISFREWVHPRNAVVNCIALILDGMVICKFSLTYDGKLLVAEIRDRDWIDFKFQVGDVLTFEEFLALIPYAKTKDVFGERSKDRKEAIKIMNLTQIHKKQILLQGGNQKRKH